MRHDAYVGGVDTKPKKIFESKCIADDPSESYVSLSAGKTPINVRGKRTFTPSTAGSPRGLTGDVWRYDRKSKPFAHIQTRGERGGAQTIEDITRNTSARAPVRNRK